MKERRDIYFTFQKIMLGKAICGEYIDLLVIETQLLVNYTLH